MISIRSAFNILITFTLMFGFGWLTPFLMTYFGIEYKKRNHWRKLATANGLTFVPTTLFRGAYLTGRYRQRLLKVETEYDWLTTFTRTRISLTTSAGLSPADGARPAPDISDAVKKIKPLLTPHLSPEMLRGKAVSISDRGERFDLETSGVETGHKYLRFAFDLLSDLAEAYPSLVEVGGELAPPLKDVVATKDHPLRPVAIQLLHDIERQTTARYGDRPTRFICPTCLARYAAHQVRLSELKTVTYFGCRQCGQSRTYLENARCWVVAVLDNRSSMERTDSNGIIRVNWLARPTLFDFDSIEIVQATDKEVERFAIHAGNDTDSTRKSLYSSVSCTIAPGCSLSENTIRILKRMFGAVTMQDPSP